MVPRGKPNDELLPRLRIAHAADRMTVRAAHTRRITLRKQSGYGTRALEKKHQLYVVSAERQLGCCGGAHWLLGPAAEGPTDAGNDVIARRGLEPVKSPGLP